MLECELLRVHENTPLGVMTFSVQKIGQRALQRKKQDDTWLV